MDERSRTQSDSSPQPFTWRGSPTVSHVLTSIILLVSALGCDDEAPESPLSSTGAGPEIIFSLSSHPTSLGEDRGEAPLPLPNDVIFSGASARPAGGHEEGARGAFKLRDDLVWRDQMSAWSDQIALLGGFPLNPLISLPLSAPIDLEDLLGRHGNTTPLDDAIYLMCVSSKCAGELSPLEIPAQPLSLGLFAELDAVARADDRPTPSYLSRLSAPIPPDLSDEVNTARGDESALSLIWGNDQQREGSMIMSPSPSLGRDSVTLYLQPKRALRPGVSYAVVVTRALRSETGRVQSPFNNAYHPEQLDLATQLSPHLDALGITLEDIVIAWRFTTGDRSKLYQTLRAGLSGDATDTAFTRRVSQLKPHLYTAHTWVTEQSILGCERREGANCRAATDQVALMREGVLGLALAWGESQRAMSSEERLALIESYQAVRGLFSGELNGWSVRAWRGQPSGDELSVGDQRVPFWCVIPERGRWVDSELIERERAAPFPLLMWAGDQGDERLNLLLWAGHFARAGFASCAVESAPESSGVAESGAFALQLGVEWRDQPWDTALALSFLNDHRRSALMRGDPLSERPLNRALISQQLVQWLTRPSSRASSEPQLGNLRELISLNLNAESGVNNGEERGGVTYGGEGEGASVAALNASLDLNSLGLVVVDPQANTAQSLASARGALGADYLLRVAYGPWLTWRPESAASINSPASESGWSWRALHTSEIPVNLSAAQLDEESTPNERWRPRDLSDETLEGKWVALYNERSGELGPRKLFNADAEISLTVASHVNDALSLHVFTSLQSELPSLISAEQVSAPWTGWGAIPGSERARLAWRVSHWASALDDPLEVTPQLKRTERSSSSSDGEVRSLVIAHPRSARSVLSGSLRLIEELRVGAERSAQAALYHQDPFAFLRLSQAYEPIRAWGAPWLDWDDLDELTATQPPFTRNVQMLLSRPTERGGYHALRLPWRLDHQTGLALPSHAHQTATNDRLPHFTLNLIGTFLVGLHRSASAEELSEPCLNWSPPQLQACPYFTVTDEEIQGR